MATTKVYIGVSATPEPTQSAINYNVTKYTYYVTGTYYNASAITHFTYLFTYLKPAVLFAGQCDNYNLN